jgi:hypothetical protein
MASPATADGYIRVSHRAGREGESCISPECSARRSRASLGDELIAEARVAARARSVSLAGVNAGTCEPSLPLRE